MTLISGGACLLLVKSTQSIVLPPSCRKSPRLAYNDAIIIAVMIMAILDCFEQPSIISIKSAGMTAMPS